MTQAETATGEPDSTLDIAARFATLDDVATYARLDPGGMHHAIRALPRQAREAWAAGCDWPLPPGFRTPSRVLVLGMGGSAIGADVVATLAAHRSETPVEVVRNYHLPPLDDRALVIASSCSGDTEETVAAFTAAVDRGAMCMAMTTGGRVGEIAGDRGVPLFRYHWKRNPRSAFGYGLFPVLAILARLGVLEVDEAEIARALDGLEADAAALDVPVPAAGNRAKQLAARLPGSVPVVVGTDFLDVAARRWATQINENAKQWAFPAALPEIDHNAIVGFGAPEGAVEQLRLLLLDAACVHPRNRLRVGLTATELARAGVRHEVVPVAGDSALEAVTRACLLGDWTSLYLGMLNGVDPNTTDPIERLKAQLAAQPAG